MERLRDRTIATFPHGGLFRRATGLSLPLPDGCRQPGNRTPPNKARGVQGQTYALPAPDRARTLTPPLQLSTIRPYPPFRFPYDLPLRVRFLREPLGPKVSALYALIRESQRPKGNPEFLD